MALYETYKIVRFYAPGQPFSNTTIKTGLTLEEAQEHCSREDTRKEDEWFDGYTKE